VTEPGDQREPGEPARAAGSGGHGEPARAAGSGGHSGRRRRTALYSALAIGAVLAAFVGVLATRPNAADQQARSPLLGEQAPPIVGTSITTGTPFSLASLRGKYVLVNFFASWCVPCQQEQAQLVRFDHGPSGHTAVVAVLFSDTPGPAKSFLRSNGGDWPALPDPNGQLALNYGVRGPPESYLLDPGGVVLAKFVGEVSADRLDQLVAEAAA
jgi:cytochrome c biogenesis protein CcmG, thiol:disulfide interchange protein DsbE